MKDIQELDRFAFYRKVEECVCFCAMLEFPNQFRCKGNLLILVLYDTSGFYLYFL